MGQASTKFAGTAEAGAILRGFAPLASRRIYCTRVGKVPHVASGAKLTGAFNDPKLPDKLLTLEDALDRVGRGPFDGVGVVFYPGCGLVGLDLDKCIASGGKWCMSAVQREALKPFIGGCYAEVSMSGTGLHAFALGDAPTVKANGSVELFGDRNFIALTGLRGMGVIA